MQKSLYVRLDEETFEALRQRAKEERREPSDQAAIELREKLREETKIAAGTRR